MKSIKKYLALTKNKTKQNTQTFYLTYRYLTFQLMKKFDFFILLRFHHIFPVLRKQ